MALTPLAALMLRVFIDPERTPFLVLVPWGLALALGSFVCIVALVVVVSVLVEREGIAGNFSYMVAFAPVLVVVNAVLLLFLGATGFSTAALVLWMLSSALLFLATPFVVASGIRAAHMFETGVALLYVAVLCYTLFIGWSFMYGLLFGA